VSPPEFRFCAADDQRGSVRDSPKGTPKIVGIFGGSFNPPHLAHVLAAAVVLATNDVERLLVVPTFQHPFAKSLAPYEDRVTMCTLAMGWLPTVEVSRVEQELGGESRTLRTVQHLHKTHPSWNLRLVMGADLLLESPKWFGFDAIAKIAPPLVLGRVGVDAKGAPPPVLPDISSTDVRAKIQAQDWDALAHLVPHAVVAHVRARGLYA
jgi:nicotinate-nucleotide adenylyltransferase